MKFLYSFILLIVVYHEASAGMSISPDQVLARINRIPVVSVLSKKIGVSCKNKDNFKQKTEDMVKCYMDRKGKETVCGSIQDSLQNCTQPMVTAFESCIDVKYHDIPKFIVDIAKSVTEYACKSKGEKLLELFHPCVTRLSNKKSNVCLKSFKQKIDNIEKDQDITNVKIDICKSLETTKACLLKDFKAVCPNEITLESVTGLYDALITKPCKHI